MESLKLRSSAVSENCRRQDSSYVREATRPDLGLLENSHDSKCKFCTLNCTLDCTLDCTLEDVSVLNILLDNPSATQKEIASIIGKSERKVKTITVNLTQKGMIERKKGRRNGFWQINVLE